MSATGIAKRICARRWRSRSGELSARKALRSWVVGGGKGELDQRGFAVVEAESGELDAEVVGLGVGGENGVHRGVESGQG
jgi:hypothetical protein